MNDKSPYEEYKEYLESFSKDFEIYIIMALFSIMIVIVLIESC